MSAAPLRYAVVGATGLVGRAMVKLLDASELEIGELALYGSDQPSARTLEFRGNEVPVEPASREALEHADVVLSSAGGSVSRDLLPHARDAGAVCVDNTSAFRMDPDVPLVVPEVNGHLLDDIHPGRGGAIIANPNCSTIQLVTALKPLHDAATIERCVVSTYQSVSGAGREASRTFQQAARTILDGVTDLPPGLQRTAAFDTLPCIGETDEEGLTQEERKMVNETPKILGASVEMDVCCVRVPVFTGHAESVLVQTAKPLSVEDARAALAAAPGIELDDVDAYTTPREVAGRHAVHVSRVRKARTTENGLLLWIVADNLLKGAALNAVQIVERMLATDDARVTAGT